MRSPRAVLRPARFPFVAQFMGKAMALGYRLTGKDRYDDFRLERVQGVPILVTPSVFNPSVPRTGAFLAAQLDARVVDADADVLDMGTGSGVCAVFAARYARRVVAVDINPAAVRCAGINARLNHAENRIEVRHGAAMTRREITSGGGHASGQLGWWHFGLGDAAKPEIRVIWPGGAVGEWQAVSGNAFYIVERDKPAREWTPK